MKFDISASGLKQLGLTVEEFEDVYEACSDCQGLGGDDWSRDCEVYDDWHNCETCDGHGFVPIGENC